MFFHTWCMGYFCVWKVFLSYKLPSAQCSCTIYRNQDACRIPKIYSSYWKKQHNSVLLHWLPLFHTLLYYPSILRLHIQMESCSISVWVCIIWFHGTSSSFSLAVTNLSSCFFHICLLWAMVQWRWNWGTVLHKLISLPVNGNTPKSGATASHACFALNVLRHSIELPA